MTRLETITNRETTARRTALVFVALIALATLVSVSGLAGMFANV